MKHLFIITAFLFCCLSIIAQEQTKKESTITISGTVLDEFNAPIPGANVFLKDRPGVGTVTNMDGKFQVSAPQNGHLKISYIGYETQEVAIKDRQLLKIVLKEESTALNEVVVEGYDTMKRKEMTSAISHVGAKDLNQISSLDASMLLKGKVSSVSVSSICLSGLLLLLSFLVCAPGVWGLN